MATSRNDIKQWFETGDVPTQAQFWETFDSFFHKDDDIPIERVLNLVQYLSEKASQEALTNHINDLESHAGASILMVNGNPFTFRKNPDNNDPLKAQELEANDFISTGAWDSTEFWELAIALGTDKDTKGNWNVLKSTIEIPNI